MSEQRTVLLVEDDAEIRDVASLRLRTAGYHTVHAADGEEGISKALECHPDAIVMDVRMPKTDGMTALTTLKARRETQRIPIVMLSASIVDQQRALEAGARFFIAKPYQGRDLLASVSAAIEEDITLEHSQTSHQ